MRAASAGLLPFRCFALRHLLSLRSGRLVVVSGFATYYTSFIGYRTEQTRRTLLRRLLRSRRRASHARLGSLIRRLRGRGYATACLSRYQAPGRCRASTPVPLLRLRAGYARSLGIPLAYKEAQGER